MAVLAFVAMAIVVERAEPTLRTAVIDTLSEKFKSRVELDALHVSVGRGFLVSGAGLRIFGERDPNNHEPGIQPIIDVKEFEFRIGILAILQSPRHVDTVYVTGMDVNLPPREQRSEMRPMGPKRGKIEIRVDRLECADTKLVINTSRPGKLPLEFDIQSLKMTDVGPDWPMRFDAQLTNPKPVGNILSSGSFGPWQAESPRDTPVSGNYTFNHADLGTIKGIGGILSSTGKYEGVLDKIVVDGSTDTPDFRIAISGRPTPLHTDFHATVDGTNGDTYLQPVRARILDSWLEARGSVVKTQDPKGHRVTLDVTMERGRIEDLLKLAVRTEPPILTGTVRLQTKFDLPAGEPDVANRLKLAGDFQITGSHFTSDKIQGKIDELSLRSQAKAKQAAENISDGVVSGMNGTFRLASGALTFSRLDFRVPGAKVALTGTYSLDGNQFDFYGKALMDAELSQMVGGWKSVLLKPVNPFFHKDGAGTEIPIKITGTRSEPHFGLDFGRKGEKKTAKTRVAD